MFHNYTINDNLVNNCDLYFILNNTSNEYTTQGVYTANGFIGTISDSSQVYLTMYGTTVSPYVHLYR